MHRDVVLLPADGGIVAGHGLRLVHQHRDALERLGVAGLVNRVVLQRRGSLGADDRSAGGDDRRRTAIQAVVRLVDACERICRGQVHRDVVLLPADGGIVAGHGSAVVDQNRRRSGAVLVVGKVV